MKNNENTFCKSSELNTMLQTLNEAYKADASAIHSLICNRVPCNQALADHPTIQVEINNMTPTETFSVGMLGIINGLVERLTGKRIAAKFSEPDETGRSKFVGFMEYPEEKT